LPNIIYYHVGQWKTVKEEQSMLPADSDTALRQVASAMKEKSHQRHPHGDVNSSSPPLSPKARASSPPQWRFVANAKKSCGYSSKSAGNVVLGLSADELAAKYTPPDVGSMARNIEQRQIGRLDIREHQSLIVMNSSQTKDISSRELLGVQAVLERNKTIMTNWVHMKGA
jgi:hypothetical protein